MKTLKLIFALAVIFIAQKVEAQTIAVAPINTYKISAHSSTASKMVRMELIRLNKYSVLDQFDMYEVENIEDYDSCFAKKCLIEYGQALEVAQIISGSIEKIGPKIVITLKLINVNGGDVQKTVTEEFDDQEAELQRMIGLTVQKLAGIEQDADLAKSLAFKNEVITSNNVGRVNNSGPRMGVAVSHGSFSEFLTRPTSQGGLDMAPVFTNIGYQFEAQYVGTENFSALFEFIPTLNGLEQGKFLPSLAVLNGFRFGKSGWEFAFGPSFGITKKSQGFFDHDLVYSNEGGRYWSDRDLKNAGFDNSAAAIKENGYYYTSITDNRSGSDVKLSTRWIMGFGRTFQSGALNVPVNIFYSSVKKGGMLGLSVGFNITRSKKNINQ